MAILFAFLLLFPSVAAQQSSEAPETYEVWLCPIHSDEQSTGEGNCSICRRPYEKRELVSVWSCPMHPQIEEHDAGECPICHMDLTRTTRELAWYCPNHEDVVSYAPGTCPHDGVTLESRAVAMAHGDHNAKHGGILFMAANGFNHLEGTLDDKGEFRLYLYDNFTKPLDARDYAARIDESPLAPSSDGDYLAAQLGNVPFPAELVLHMRFDEAEEEQRFDFIFVGEPLTTASWISAELIIPSDGREIYKEILKRDERIRELIERGVWPDLYIPALEAKDLALGLSEKEGKPVALPVKKIVRAAWLLDMYGDLGNKSQVESAYHLFETGIEELRGVYDR
jgi:hypothetical protein